MAFDPKPVLRDGRQVDWLTDAALRECERRLGYPLTVVQGHNPGGVKASAGTHDRWGVIDLKPWDWERKVRILRAVGFAAWHRPAIAGLWPEHIHAVLIDHPDLAPAAAAQVVSYRAGRNGLKGNAPDPTWRPSPIPVFRAPAPLPAPTIQGIDISHHQSGRLNFAKAKTAGVRFVFHKATQGDTVSDALYATRRKQVSAAGLIWGAYHFARPAVSNGTEQAKRFLAAAALRPGDLRPALDIETRDGCTDDQLERFVAAFAAECLDELGVSPIIYTPFPFKSWRGPLWVARYSDANTEPKIPTPWGRFAIWQFSNGVNGTPNAVPGIPGRVDINTLHPKTRLEWLQIPASTDRKA
jgi:GH25 family lysozyme M1 (1,4-beta-N-acetylmuramidase)